uniref:Uncharacterized protein n=1 Tax=Anguilla anguilla TaxID=7936 RepID=A0A0E9WJ24_ANGAN
MSLDCGRKPEYREETHVDTGRTYKIKAILHTERPRPDVAGLGLREEFRAIRGPHLLVKQAHTWMILRISPGFKSVLLSTVGV